MADGTALDVNIPAGIETEWAGDFADQSESTAFLGKAFAGALFLMFIILLAQFNSVYNAVLVLLAVVLSTTGVLVGMLVMNQPFSIIMTGTGIVALAGIVVGRVTAECVHRLRHSIFPKVEHGPGVFEKIPMFSKLLFFLRFRPNSHTGPVTFQSTLDLREIRDIVHCSTKTRKQVETRRAHVRIVCIDRHLVKERIDRRAQAGKRGHRSCEVFRLDGGGGLRLGSVERFDQRLFGGFGGVGQFGGVGLRHLRLDDGLHVRVVHLAQRVFLARAGDFAFDAVPVFLLEDIRRALVSCEQVLAVLGLHEGLERMDAGQVADNVVLALRQSENRVDKIMPNPGIALLHLEAIDKEVWHCAIEIGAIMLGKPCVVIVAMLMLSEDTVRRSCGDVIDFDTEIIREIRY